MGKRFDCFLSRHASRTVRLQSLAVYRGSAYLPNHHAVNDTMHHYPNLAGCGKSQIERAYSPPCITARRGGCVIKKISRSDRFDAAGVVYRQKTKRKTTPASHTADASQYFLDCSATPPCGDARRGLWRSILFFSSLLGGDFDSAASQHRPPLLLIALITAVVTLAGCRATPPKDDRAVPAWETANPVASLPELPLGIDHKWSDI